MKNRTNIVIELVVLLALCIGVTLVISKNYEERADEQVNLDTPMIADDQAPTWYLDDDLDAAVEETLIQPLREKYGVQNPEEAMSRCASYVGYNMNGAEKEVDADGFYNGTLYVGVGCELYKQADFRMDTTATSFEIKEEDGNFVPLEDWLKAE